MEPKLGGRLLGCFDCLSLWLAAPLAAWLGADAADLLLLWPALSAGVMLLTRATERTLVTSPPGLDWPIVPGHVAPGGAKGEG